MPNASINVPDRWKKGDIQIKSFIENYTLKVSQPLTIALGKSVPWDAGEVTIKDDTIINLNPGQRTALENAVNLLNGRLLHEHQDPWQANFDGQTELIEQLDEIERLLGI